MASSILASVPLMISQIGVMGSPKLKCLRYPSHNLSVPRLSVTMRTRVISCDVSASSPWLMIPPSMEGVYNFYSLEEKKVLSLKRSREEGPDEDALVVGSSHGWLALFNHGSNRDLFLSNPVTRHHIKLPPIDTLPLRRDVYACEISAEKVIISCPPDEEEEECRAMMIFEPGNSLAFCCPNRSNTEWTPIGILINRLGHKKQYEDCTYWKRNKEFVCITHCDELECWDLRDPLCPRSYGELLEKEYIQWLWEWEEVDDDRCVLEQYRYLVSASDRLYLVTRHFLPHIGPNGAFVEYEDSDDTCPYKTVGFDVHRIERDDEMGKVRLRHMPCSLDGLAMFVGLNDSFAIEVEADGEFLKPNSIYFTDDRKHLPWVYEEDVPYGGHDSGIFDYQNTTISPCYYPCDFQSIRRIIPVPLWFALNH